MSFITKDHFLEYTSNRIKTSKTILKMIQKQFTCRHHIDKTAFHIQMQNSSHKIASFLVKCFGDCKKVASTISFVLALDDPDHDTSTVEWRKNISIHFNIKRRSGKTFYLPSLKIISNFHWILRASSSSIFSSYYAPDQDILCTVNYKLKC